jgi:hypothetical protein
MGRCGKTALPVPNGVQKTAPELRLKAGSKVSYQKGAVLCPILPLLFLDHNALAEFPVHEYTLEVHASDGGVSRLRDYRADICNEVIGQ